MGGHHPSAAPQKAPASFWLAVKTFAGAVKKDRTEPEGSFPEVPDGAGPLAPSPGGPAPQLSSKRHTLLVGFGTELQ